MKRISFVLACIFISAAVSGAEGPCVVPGRGYFRIHLGTGGIFGAFAHEHFIEAQKIAGCATIDSKDALHSSVKLNFATASIRVIDPKESAKDRAEVQKTMENEVLRISEYPQITFESTSIERGNVADQYRVRGNLTIRGKSQPVVIPLTFTRSADGTYRVVGRYSFKQTSFGINPIKVAGGAAKVKDELQTEFDLFLK